MKHKHADVIKAWADGAIIQFKNPTGCNWTDCVGNHPYWQDNIDYRIKPEPKPDVVRYVTCDFRLGSYSVFSSKHESDDLKLTFDGETGKLKSTEILK